MCSTASSGRFEQAVVPVLEQFVTRLRERSPFDELVPLKKFRSQCTRPFHSRLIYAGQPRVSEIHPLMSHTMAIIASVMVRR